MFGFFGNKKKLDEVRNEVRTSFDHVKKDFDKIGNWIKHFDDKHENKVIEMEDMKEQLKDIQMDLNEIKDFISVFNNPLQKENVKQMQTTSIKQTMPLAVQTPVQTPVQTDILESFTIMERAIIWALLNSEMMLSYEDLAALLGKDKSTIRGQINTIKQKDSEIIMEKREFNGKKRLFIPESVKERVLKGVRVRVKKKREVKTEK